MTSSTKIADLQDLIDQLRQGDYQNVLDQIEELELTEEELAPYAHFSPEHYTRNCILRNDELELILLCWEPGQETAVHCHDDQECFVKVVSGTFEERIFTFEDEQLVKQSQSVYTAGEVTSMQETDLFHCLINGKGQRGMSLHLYMGPIEQCRVYDSRDRNMHVRELHYHSINGKLLDT